MLIRKHLVYVDEESIRSIRSSQKLKDHKAEFEKELEKKRKEILEKAEEEAKKLIENAKEEAERLIQEARVRAQEIIEDSRKRYEKEIEEYEALKVELSRVISSFESKIEEAVENLSNETLPLLKVIVRKILLKEIDDETALRRLKSSISKILETKDVKIRLNPKDVELVKEEVERLGYEIVPDPRLEKGDVVIETGLGILDMSTSYGLKMIEDIIDEVI